MTTITYLIKNDALHSDALWLHCIIITLMGRVCITYTIENLNRIATWFVMSCTHIVHVNIGSSVVGTLIQDSTTGKVFVFFIKWILLTAEIGWGKWLIVFVVLIYIRWGFFVDTKMGLVEVLWLMRTKMVNLNSI